MWITNAMMLVLAILVIVLAVRSQRQGVHLDVLNRTVLGRLGTGRQDDIPGLHMVVALLLEKLGYVCISKDGRPRGFWVLKAAGSGNSLTDRLLRVEKGYAGKGVDVRAALDMLFRHLGVEARRANENEDPLRQFDGWKLKDGGRLDALESKVDQLVDDTKGPQPFTNPFALLSDLTPGQRPTMPIGESVKLLYEHLGLEPRIEPEKPSRFVVKEKAEPTNFWERGADLRRRADETMEEIRVKTLAAAAAKAPKKAAKKKASSRKRRG